MQINKKTVEKHYKELKEPIKEFGCIDGKERLASKGPSSGWYEYPEGYDEGSVKRPRYLNQDYERLADVAAIPVDGELPKSIYATITMIDEEDREEYVKEKGEEQNWNEVDALPDYEDLKGFNLFADVDIKDDKKQDRDDEEVKNIIEKAIKYIVKEYKELAPNSVFILDSGGGFYPFIHHKTLEPVTVEFDGEKKSEVIQEIMNRFNKHLKSIEEEMNKDVIGVKQILKIDKINHKNRLFKAPGSIHRSMNAVVKPIKTSDVSYDRWSLPLNEEQKQELSKWVQDYRDFEPPEDELNNLIKKLFPGYSGDWENILDEWYEEKLEEKKERKRKREELTKKKIDTELEHIKGYPITNNVEDVFDAIDKINCMDFAKEYDYESRGDGTISFNPPWRQSESGRGAFASTETFTDREDMSTGGPAKFVAIEEGLITHPSEDLSKRDWFKAVDLLRNQGYEIPIYLPDAEDSEYDSMPRSSIQKAAEIFGIIDSRSDLKHVVRNRWDEDKEEMVEKEFFWLEPDHWNRTIRKLEEKGFKVNRDKKYFTMPESPKGKRKFVPKLLAEDIEEEFQNIVTLKDFEKGFSQIHFYKDGIYKPGGEAKIRELARRKLGEKASNNYVRQVVHHVKETNYIDINKFNNSKNEIVVENGILNLDTGELRDFDPEFLSTRKIPVKYDPDAECPEIKKFMDEVTDTEDKKRTLQEFVGHAISPEYILRKALLCYGETGNGKTVFLDLVARLLGESNVAGESLHDLCNASTRFSTYNLYGKLANIDPDLSSGKLRSTGTFKSLTGGDRVNAEKKKKQAFTFKNKATLLFSCNDIPTTKDKSPAFYNRWIIIEFPYQFKKNPESGNEYEKQKIPEEELMNKLTTEEEMSGFLNWAMEGRNRLKERDRFTIDPSVEEIRRIYEMGSNDVYEFKEEVLLTKKRASKMLRNDDNIWIDTGLEVVKETEDGKELKNGDRTWIEPIDRVWKVFNEWVMEKNKDVDIEKAAFSKALNKIPEIRKGKARIGDIKKSGEDKGNRKEKRVWKKVRIKEKWLSDHGVDIERKVPEKREGAVKKQDEPQKNLDVKTSEEKEEEEDDDELVVEESFVEDSDSPEVTRKDVYEALLEVTGEDNIVEMPETINKAKEKLDIDSKELNRHLNKIKQNGNAEMIKHGKLRLTED